MTFFHGLFMIRILNFLEFSINFDYLIKFTYNLDKHLLDIL